DDGPHLAHRRPGRDAFAAGIRPRVRADDLLAPDPSLLLSAATPRGARDQHRFVRPQLDLSRGGSGSGGGAAGGARGAGVALARPAARALLRAHDRFAGGWPVGLAQARHGRRVGAGRGDPLKRMLDMVLGAIGTVLSAPLIAALAAGIRL